MLGIASLPPEVSARKPGLLDRVLGGILFRERLVFVDRTQSEPRGRFTEAHETVHKLMPWHEASFRLDDKHRLFGPTREILEAEANYGAAVALFQGSVFMEIALGYRVTIATPMALADDFATSRHAAIRYYVESHPDAVALVVAGRYPHADGTVPVWLARESSSFRRRYGSVLGALGMQKLPMAGGTSLGEIVAEAMTSGDPTQGNLTISNLAAELRPIVAEAFFNQHCVFLLLAERGATRFGRRVSVRSGQAQSIAHR